MPFKGILMYMYVQILYNMYNKYYMLIKWIISHHSQHFDLVCV